jgi:predicted ATPase
MTGLAGRWQLRLLGGLSGRNGDLQLSRLQPQPRRVLAYLVLHTDNDVAREDLSRLIWPHTVKVKRRASLTVALNAVRKVLEVPGMPAGSVLADANDQTILRLRGATVHSDVQEFKRLAKLQRAEEALACWGGTLLPGLEFPHPEDDGVDWLNQERIELEKLHQKMRDLLDAEQLQQLQPAHELPTAPPVPIARTWALHDDPFFGRQRELQWLLSRVPEHRVVTVTGPGGVGKSRLAEEAIRTLTHRFNTFQEVPLFRCPSADLLGEHLRAALQLQRADMLPLDQVVHALYGQRCLLLLDCCEHLVDGHADRAGRTLQSQLSELLLRLPELHILATSRSALQLGDEQVLKLRPLALPAPNAPLEVAQKAPVVQLFVDRARSARSDLSLHPGNLLAIMTLCRAVGGLPLAVQLLAKRWNSLKELRETISGMSAEAAGYAVARLLSLPVGGRRGAVRLTDAQHSLQAVLDWSRKLLKPVEGRFLQSLCALRGSFDAAAAAAVSAQPLAGSHALLQRLAQYSLVDRVGREASGRAGPARWRILDVLRIQLETQASAAPAANWRERHREHFVATAESLAAGYQRPSAADEPNLSHALYTALQDKAAAQGIELALALQWHWVARGVSAQDLDVLLQLAADLATGATAPTPLPGSLQAPPALLLARVHALLARLLLHHGRGQEAYAHGLQARAQAARLGVLARCARHQEPSDGAARPLPAALRADAQADALLAYVSVHWRGGAQGVRPGLLKPARQALARAQHSGQPQLVAQAANQLGMITLEHLRQVAPAKLLFKQAQREFTADGNRAGAFAVLPNRIYAAQLRAGHAGRPRNHTRLLALMAAEIKWARALGEIETELLLLNRQSLSLQALGHHAQATEVLQDLVRLAQRRGLAYHWTLGVWNLCESLVETKALADAAPLLAWVEQHWVKTYGPLDGGDQRWVRGLEQRLFDTKALGPVRGKKLWLKGLALTPEQACHQARQAGTATAEKNNSS